IFVAYAVAVLALAKRYLLPWFALAATTLCLLHLYTIFLSDLLFAELPFALVSVVFALVAVSGPAASRQWLRETTSFVLAVAGFLLRTAGVVLFAAWLLEALIRRRFLQRAQHRLPGRALIPLRFVSVPIFGFAALVVAGLVVLIRRGAWFMVFIVLGSVGLTCTTPWPRQFARYLSPLAPFLTIAAV